MTEIRPADPIPLPAELASAQPSEDDFDLYDTWAPRRTSRLTAVLGIGILVTAGFGVGVLVQKNHDATLTAAATTGRAAAFARAFGGAGGFEAAGTGGGAGTGSGGTPSAAPPIVVGTVTAVHGSTVSVKNFAGAGVTVQVPATASVTTPGLSPVVPGMTVSVSGTTTADGTVSAAALTARRPH
jgi:hypothetical protein